MSFDNINLYTHKIKPKIVGVVIRYYKFTYCGMTYVSYLPQEKNCWTTKFVVEIRKRKKKLHIL